MPKICIKASNGKYFSAEQGGGLVYSGSFYGQPYDPYPAPLYANREFASPEDTGPWERFDLIDNGNGSVSIQTCNGFFWTSEMDGGQGISTNRTGVNAWEQFYLSADGKSLQCNDRNHYVTYERDADCHVNATRTAIGEYEQFEIVNLDKPDVTWPSIDAIRTWKGNICGLPLSLPYSPRGMLWTPGYVCYDDQTRDRIRKAYRDNGWTHYPLNLTNHSTIYRDYFPQWDDTLINKYLTELLGAGLIPVGYAMGDEDTTVNTHADPSLVPIALGKWEDATPIKRPALDSDNRFYLVHEKFPDSILYWHNPPYQGAPFVDYADWNLPQDDPAINATVWQYMVKSSFVQGLLFQGQAWNNDAKDSMNALGDFALRLGTGYHGWPIADLVDYEETAYYMFNMGGDYNQALAWTDKIRRNVSPLNGFGNG